MKLSKIEYAVIIFNGLYLLFGDSNSEYYQHLVTFLISAIIALVFFAYIMIKE